MELTLFFLCSFVEEIQIQNFDIYSVNEVIIHTQKYVFFFHNWINKLLSEENKVPEHGLKLERWQGLPHVNKVIQCETVVSFKVSFYISLIQGFFKHKKNKVTVG